METFLLHRKDQTPSERTENFSRFLKNLYDIAENDPEGREIVEEATRRFYRLLANFYFLPNSPTLMNAGRQLQQLSACYVLPVPDSMEGIFESVKNQALIHQSGGGTGFSFGRLRPQNDEVKSTKGIASGPLSFMKIFDIATEQVKQGGTRRGANMAILPYTHPNIVDFVTMKNTPGVLENFNISVGIDSKFINALKEDGEFDLINPRNQKPAGKMKARELFNLIIDGAWRSGDPGYVVLDRINDSGSNPTPAIGPIEATNPCFAGDVRLATDCGLLTFDKLYQEQTEISVATDNRVLTARATYAVGNTALAYQMETGVTLRRALPVFKTRKDWPVFRLETEHGLEVTATADHKFFTPTGPVELKDLRPDDEILIQSGAGAWNSNDALPPFLPEDKLRARIERGEANPPKKWSRELGELLGWAVGDGWVSSETPEGRSVPNHTVGLMFGDEEKRCLAPKFQALLKAWLGMEGTAIERNGSLALYYKSGAYYFLKSLGLHEPDGLLKEVPEAIWSAPREAVLGFLSALFTADGTVNVSAHKASCSVRLANSSKQLLKQVQLLLLNEGIVAKLYLRRKAGEKMMPDSNRKPKLYKYAAQYELVLDGASRDRFLDQIGFLTPSKQKKALAWLSTKQRRSNQDTFTDCVRIIEPAGTTDVYCTTEPETHSIVAAGLVVTQCGEQPLLPNEPCNLGSINLAKFITIQNGYPEMDYPRLRETIYECIHFLDNVIDVNNYPIPEIEEIAKGNRRIGLGVMGWAETLVKLGVPYDSEEAIHKAEEVMEFMNRSSLEASETLARERGVFPNFKQSIYDATGPYFRGEARRPRNCARTTIAPTGTIAIAAGLQGSGIEPFFAISYTRYNAKGIDAVKQGKTPAPEDTFVEINPLFKRVAEENNHFGLRPEVLWDKIDKNHKSIRGIAEIPEKIQRLFATSHEVSFEQHIRAQAAFQKHTDNAVSKTINCPNETPREDLARAYLLAYELGCKGLTIYRDGSKAQQVLNLHATKTEKKESKAQVPNFSEGVTSEYYEKKTGYGTLHVNIIYTKDGPYRIFTNIPPIGTEVNCLTSVIGILLSKYFETGGDPERILKHLNSAKGDRPYGFGPTRVDSIPHAISQVLREHLKKTGKLKKAAESPNGKTQPSGNGKTASGNGHTTTTPETEAKAEERSAAETLDYCPKCYSSNVEFVSGCKEPTCFDCGYSNCS